MTTMAVGWIVNPILSHATAVLMTSTQIESLTSQIVGQRPNRVEPRAVKRRPKPLRLLNIPREEARELLLRGIDLFKRFFARICG